MSTATKLDPMGLKRICTNCGVRFYDLNKRPIICPSCETEFTGEIKVKGRRGRISAINKKDEVPKEDENLKKETAADDDDDALLDDEDHGVEVVSLEDAEKPSSNDESNDDPAALKEESNDELDSIPAFESDIDDDIEDDDTLLDNEDD